MTTLHKNLTGTDLHEPKGVATATSGQVYVANGLGSGTWASPATGFDINGLTQLTTPAVGDFLPIYDLSIAANRKITTVDLLETVNVLAALTAPAVSDLVMVYDASAATVTKMTLVDLLETTNVLTSLTAPAIDDQILIYDTSATTVTKITPVDLLEVLNVLTEDTTPDLAADFALTYDTSASTVKKAKPTNLYTYLSNSNSRPLGYTTGAGSTVTQITNKTTGVTINSLAGQITTSAAALSSGSIASFVVTNSTVTADCVILLTEKSNFGGYAMWASNVVAGAFTLNIINHFVISHSDAIVINFAVFEGATS